MGDELYGIKAEVFGMYSSDGGYIPLGEIKSVAITETTEDEEYPIAQLNDNVCCTFDLDLSSHRRAARRLYKMLGLSYVESIFPKKKKRKRNRLYRRRMRFWS